MSESNSDYFEVNSGAALAFVTAPVWLPFLIGLSKIFGRERVDRLMCWLTSHDWADEDRYGTKPVCLYCGTERGE